MNNLTDVIADLQTAAGAYYDRAHANGPAHPDTAYLMGQGARFRLAAEFIEAACTAAAEHAAFAAIISEAELS